MNDQSRLVNRHAVDQLADVRAEIKILQTREKAIAAEISAMMGENDSLGGNQWIARQSVTKRKGSIDTKALEAAGIDVDQYRKPDTTVFSIRLEQREMEAV